MGTLLNTEDLSKGLKDFLNEEMLKAAEPLVQEALKEVEIEMRAKLASKLIAYLDHNLQIDRFGADLRILIKQE